MFRASNQNFRGGRVGVINALTCLAPISMRRYEEKEKMLLDEMKMNIILSASRSLPGQVPKKLELGSSFSQSGSSLGSFLVDFSISGSTLGALGPTFDAQKRLGRPKVPQEAPPRKYPHLLGPIWGSFFEYFLIFWHLFSSIVFC